jgi:hypothetical protein
LQRLVERAAGVEAFALKCIDPHFDGRHEPGVDFVTPAQRHALHGTGLCSSGSVLKLPGGTRQIACGGVGHRSTGHLSALLHGRVGWREFLLDGSLHHVGGSAVRE